MTDKQEPIWAEKQFTEQEAVAIYDSKAWEGWTDEQIVRVQLFQQRSCLPFGRFREAIEKVLKRGVWTHEFGLNLRGIQDEFLGDKPAPTMEEIIELIPADKRIVVVVR